MEGHGFYGHAAYSRTGDVLFVVEAELERGDGAISIRDPSTFAVIGTIPTFGRAPHDCHVIENGRTLVVTNGGGPVDSSHVPSVVFVDIASRALLERHEVSDARRNTGHVVVTDAREFAVASAPRAGLPSQTSLGGVSLGRRGEPWIHMVAPEAVTARLFGEALSLAVHRPSSIVAATHPDADLLTFWNLERAELTTRFEVPSPRGVTMTLDDRFFVVSYATEARLLLVDAQTFEVLADLRRAAGVFGGAHLYTWAG
jgi:hypothetical protein